MPATSRRRSAIGGTAEVLVDHDEHGVVPGHGARPPPRARCGRGPSPRRAPTPAGCATPPGWPSAPPRPPTRRAPGAGGPRARSGGPAARAARRRCRRRAAGPSRPPGRRGRATPWSAWPRSPASPSRVTSWAWLVTGWDSRSLVIRCWRWFLVRRPARGHSRPVLRWPRPGSRAWPSGGGPPAATPALRGPSSTAARDLLAPVRRQAVQHDGIVGRPGRPASSSTVKPGEGRQPRRPAPPPAPCSSTRRCRARPRPWPPGGVVGQLHGATPPDPVGEGLQPGQLVGREGVAGRARRRAPPSPRAAPPWPASAPCCWRRPT